MKLLCTLLLMIFAIIGFVTVLTIIIVNIIPRFYILYKWYIKRQVKVYGEYDYENRIRLITWKSRTSEDKKIIF